MHTFLTHWGWVTHICVSNLTSLGPDNGLLPGRRQAIIWTDAGMLLIGPLGTNFSEILIDIHTFAFTKMHLKMSSAKWRPFCLGLIVLITSDVIRWQSSTAMQIMICCLMAPNPYLNQCCLELMGIHSTAILQKKMQDMLAMIIIYD